MNLPQKIKRASVAGKFDVTRLKRAIDDHPSKPTVFDLAATIGVTHPTMARYLRGEDIPLSKALAIRHVIAPTVPIEELWRLR